MDPNVAHASESIGMLKRVSNATTSNPMVGNDHMTNVRPLAPNAPRGKDRDHDRDVDDQHQHVRHVESGTG